MKYEEFVKTDSYGAFKEFIPVSRAKELGIVPKAYWNIFKDTCECGSEMIISKNRKKLMCCDPRCRIKIGFRLAETFNRFECENLGPSTCKSIINQMWDRLEYKSHVEVLVKLASGEPYPMILGGAKGQDFKIALHSITNTARTLANIISNLGLPELSTTARDIFNDYSSVDEFVEAVKVSGGLVKFLANHGIHDRKIAYYVEECIPDFYLSEQLIGNSIKDTAFRQVNICLTGRLRYDGLPISKSNYLQYLNDQSIAKDGTVIFEFIKCEAVSSVPYIVYSSVSNNSKYLEGLAREKANPNKKVLVTPEELVSIVREVVKEYEQGCQKQSQQ